MKQVYCETCRFWDQLPANDEGREEWGRCRRRAPAPEVHTRTQRPDREWPCWPITPFDDWCGEHEPHPEEPQTGAPTRRGEKPHD